jgi:hypothetical protein
VTTHDECPCGCGLSADECVPAQDSAIIGVPKLDALPSWPALPDEPSQHELDGHDRECEAEFIAGPNCLSPCRCADRVPLARPSREEDT